MQGNAECHTTLRLNEDIFDVLYIFTDERIPLSVELEETVARAFNGVIIAYLVCAVIPCDAD